MDDPYEREVTNSGLILPKPKPEPMPNVSSLPVSSPMPDETRRIGPLEIQTEQQRKLAKEGLLLLWDAMELSEWQGITFSGDAERHVVYDYAYKVIGELLLGDEYPEKERLT